MQYRYNGTTYTLPSYSDGTSEWQIAVSKAPAKLGMKDNDSIMYIPAVASMSKTLLYTSDTYKYYCTPSSPTIAFRKNGATYYCGKMSRTPISTTYIPAGTYTPSAFETLISKYITVNSYRTVANDIIVTVNKQMVALKAENKIYYMSNASSGATSIARAVNFSGSYKTAGSCFEYEVADGSTGFLNKKIYVVNGGSLPMFNNYSNYNITVTDIIFK